MLNTTIPPTHQIGYYMNQNYVHVIKHDIDKLLAPSFFQLVEEATWLSPTVIMLKKNGKLGIYVSFRKLNFAMKDLCPVPLIDEILNIVVGHETLVEVEFKFL